jgi:hypothetical protein
MDFPLGWPEHSTPESLPGIDSPKSTLIAPQSAACYRVDLDPRIRSPSAGNRAHKLRLTGPAASLLHVQAGSSPSFKAWT